MPSPRFTLLIQAAHSVLDPASPQARQVDRLWDFMFWVAALVFLAVVTALMWAAFHRRPAGEDLVRPAREDGMRRAVSWAAGLTVVTLLAFLVYDVSVGRAITTAPGPEALHVKVIGHQWWWEVQYPDSVPQQWVTTANEIHVPAGRPVVVELRSADVIHSFWPPNLQRQAGPDPGRCEQRVVPGRHARRLSRTLRGVLRPPARQHGLPPDRRVTSRFRPVAGGAARYCAHAGGLGHRAAGGRCFCPRPV